MYPKDIIHALKAAAATHLVPAADVNDTSIHVTRVRVEGPPNWIEDWMLAHEVSQPAVHLYFDFLRRTRQRFHAVAQKMGYWNPHASHSLGHDKWSVGWAGDALLSMASALFVLKSHGVEGGVLECGVYKGSSTACLSWVCKELELPLYAADSFKGLPSAEGHYAAGDFRGSLDEVKRNVSECGILDRVEFIPGWYSDSLKDFSHPLAMIWMDVDLQQSVIDVMENVFPMLSRNGLIFSDGFTVGIDFDGFKIRHTGGEPAGFARFLDAHRLDYKAVPGGAKGLALIVPRCRDDERVIFNPDSFAYLLHSLGFSGKNRSCCANLQ